MSLATRLLLSAQVTGGALASPPLVFMTFNILNCRNEGHPWAERKELVAGAMEFANADVVGVQEAYYEQMEWLRERLPAYECFGEGREGGREGEYAGIFYRHARFSLLAGGNLWLSQAPTVAGRFADCWGERQEVGPATCHGFEGPQRQGPRIDWILVRGPVSVLGAERVTWNRDGVWPSDHFPVVARVALCASAEMD